MDDKALKDLIRSMVQADIRDKAPVAAPPAPPPPAAAPPVAAPPVAASPVAAAPAATPRAPKAAPAPVVRQPVGGTPDEVKLAKRASLWMGGGVPLPPLLGTWKAGGDRAFYLSRTPARLGVGRAGTRYRTPTILSFQVDHAAARDAVASDLDPDMLKKQGFILTQSAAQDRREFLIRPDLGRRLTPETEAALVGQLSKTPQVQIVAADGLSATAINVNLPLVWPALRNLLVNAGIRIGTPVGIRLSRVACGDSVARIANAEILCVLVGERPGLKTAESMGAYITYMRVKDFNESKRSVISNIHQGGLVPVEGAQQIATLILRAYKDKRTGVEMTG